MSLPVRAAASLDPSARLEAREALETADRLVVGLVEREPAAVERELDLAVCAWWRDGGRLSTVHGPVAVARALAALYSERPPERLSSRATTEGSVIVSALASERLAWSLELRAEHGRVVGCVLRGASPPGAHPEPLRTSA